MSNLIESRAMCNTRKWARMCNGTDETARLITVITQLPDLEQLQKDALQYRYLHILEEYSVRCYRYAVFHHIGHFIITVGSLIVPALLSVQYADNANISANPAVKIAVYWITWSLSLLVTMFNGILILYKVDKKYYFLHTTRERLRSEGWQYVQLTGRYAGSLIQYKEKTTHMNQFIFFCHYVEKIRMRQIEEEYYKHEETNQPTSVQPDTKDGNKAAQTSGDALYGTSLSIDMDKIYDNVIKGGTPETVKSIMSSLIRSAHEQGRRSSITGKQQLTHQSQAPSQAQTTEQMRIDVKDSAPSTPKQNEVIEPPEETKSTESK